MLLAHGGRTILLTSGSAERGSRGVPASVVKTNETDHGDEHEPGDDRQMLEERIELAEALDPVERPELMGQHGCERREHAECA